MGRFDKLDDVLREFAERTVPNCSCAIAKDGELLYEGYSGLKDMETKKALGPDAIYRMASMTKLVTYTILMILQERGAVKLDQPISDFLPEWANKKKFVRQPDGSYSVEPLQRPITVRDCVVMSCGMPYCFAPAAPDCGDPTALAMTKALQPVWAKGHYRIGEVLHATADVPVLFEPGSHWLYGFGSEIVAGIVEVLTGRQLYLSMRDFIFNPLEMTDTDTLFRDNLEERLVPLYAVTPEGYRKMPKSMDSYQIPGEENEDAKPAIMSNVRDFSKFLQMWACGGVYKGNRIMSEKTLALMRQNCLSGEALREYQTENGGYNAGYGYGLGVRTLLAPLPGVSCGSVGSFGWTGGFGTWCEADPVRHLSIVYMHNTVPNMELVHHHKIRDVAYSCL